jgi:hypothetical protein
VYTEGRLIVEFSFDDMMRIRSWHFAIRNHRELVPRSVIAMQVSTVGLAGLEWAGAGLGLGWAGLGWAGLGKAGLLQKRESEKFSLFVDGIQCTWNIPSFIHYFLDITEEPPM